MRPLPVNRRTRLALAAAAAAVALAGAWLQWYRPWEARYRGRPTSWWARRLADPALTRPRPPAGGWADSYLALLGAGWDRDPHGLSLGVAGPEAVPVLAELLADPDPQVRFRAANFLGMMNPPPKEAVPALVGAWNRYKGDYRGLRGGWPAAAAPDAVSEVCVTLWRIDPAAARRAGVPTPRRAPGGGAWTVPPPTTRAVASRNSRAGGPV